MDDSIEALWAVVFKTNDDYIGSGIAVFDTGRLLGGDSAFTYIGDYKVSGGIVEGEIHVTRYSNISGLESSFLGLDEFDLVISGKFNPQKMTVQGQLKNDPDRKILIVCTRVGEFPVGTP